MKDITDSDRTELLEFVATTTYLYFIFRGAMDKKRVGTAAGRPVSPIGPSCSNLYIEWLELKALATAPISCNVG